MQRHSRTLTPASPVHYYSALYNDTAAALIGKVINRKSVVVSGLHGEPAIMLAAFGTLQPDSCTQDVERAKAVVRVMFESESA